MTDQKPFDPKLKEAMEEVKAIMKKYDIGGYIAFVSQTHSEFCFEISPSWSCAKTEGNRFRFRAKEAEYGSIQARNQAMEQTVGMILQIRDLGAQAFSFGKQMKDQLEKVMKIEHTPFKDFTPHDENWKKDK